jgi:hypothetical protein
LEVPTTFAPDDEQERRVTLLLLGKAASLNLTIYRQLAPSARCELRLALDAAVADLAIECFYRADRETANRLGKSQALNARLLGLGASRPTDRHSYWRQNRGPFGPLDIYSLDDQGR